MIINARPTTTPPGTALLAVADQETPALLRSFADILERGAAAHRPDRPAGTLLDANFGDIRCILIKDDARPPKLSPRENEIARMVSRGLTNRAIAGALDISLWTVSTHLRRIFAKLDVNNRAEMVALVCRGPGRL